MDIDNRFTLSRCGDIEARLDGDGDIFLLRTTDNRVKILNESGLMVWDLCDGTHRRQDITQALVNKFNITIDSDFEQRIHDFINTLIADGFLMEQPFSPGIQRNSKQDTENYPLYCLYLYLTLDCNLKCRHCWIMPRYSLTSSTMKVTPDVFLKAIDDALELGLRSVKLTGGEPMLYPGFKDLVSSINTRDVALGMETNGTLIDEAWADFICENRISLAVSVDGSTAKTHDLFRGVVGSFNKVTHAIRLLKERGNPPLVIFSIYRGNLHELEPTVALCAELGAKAFKVNVICEMGRGNQLRNQHLLLDAIEMYRLKREVEKDLIARYTMPIYIDVPCSFDSLTSLAQGGLPQCPFLNLLSILENGDVSFCGLGYTVPEWIMGNIQTDRITTI